jgi:hypothetical protein
MLSIASPRRTEDVELPRMVSQLVRLLFRDVPQVSRS